MAYLLAHLSDPHLGPMPMPRPIELVGKRAIGYLNWRRKRHAVHRRDVLAALVADMHAQTPDHIAVTGDLVNIALPAEFIEARTWLESIGAPHDVSLVRLEQRVDLLWCDLEPRFLGESRLRRKELCIGVSLGVVDGRRREAHVSAPCPRPSATPLRQSDQSCCE